MSSTIKRGAERRATAKREASKTSEVATRLEASPAKPKDRDRLVMTKAEMREIIRNILTMNRKSGVPEDGIAEILTQWVMAHMTRGTKVVRA